MKNNHTTEIKIEWDCIPLECDSGDLDQLNNEALSHACDMAEDGFICGELIVCLFVNGDYEEITGWWSIK